MPSPPKPLIVLASASPRREAILAALGLSFVVVPSRVGEGGAGGPSRGIGPGRPRRRAETLALAKATAVARGIPLGIVIAADTLVVCGGRALGKPRDPRQARAFLRLLRGRAHRVISGVAVVAGGGRRAAVGSEVTRVWMRPYRDAEVEAYVRTGEPLDKAGAYAIQGRGALLVGRIAGSYTNVVGLPVGLLHRLLAALGWDPWALAGPGRARNAGFFP